jgi:hypothetical protein
MEDRSIDEASKLGSIEMQSIKPDIEPLCFTTKIRLCSSFLHSMYSIEYC